MVKASSLAIAPSMPAPGPHFLGQSLAEVEGATHPGKEKAASASLTSLLKKTNINAALDQFARELRAIEFGAGR